MHEIEKQIQKQLFALQDFEYKLFQQKLIPTVEPERIIGVRTPELRKLAKAFAKTPQAMDFIEFLPHSYFEEMNLHAFVIETLKDYEQAMAYTEALLPYINNWATCDIFSPKIFKKHPAEVYEKIKIWLRSDRTYTVRFGVVTLLGNYLDQEFLPEMLDLVSDIHTDEYYINMAIAWYFSAALIKQYEVTLPFIEQNRLDKWVNNKAIQKAVESYRIDDETKAYLKSLKIK